MARKRSIGCRGSACGAFATFATLARYPLLVSQVQVKEPITRQPSPTFSFGSAEWLGIAALAFGSLHIMLDFSVGLFPITERPVSAVQAAVFLLTSLIVLWWAVSIAAAASGLGGGLASIAVLAFGWTLLTNGSSIVFCPTPCRFGAPLADIAHLGSLTSGLAATVGALWALRHRRLQPGWRLPAGAAALVLASIVAMANAAEP